MTQLNQTIKFSGSILSLQSKENVRFLLTAEARKWPSLHFKYYTPDTA